MSEQVKLTPTHQVKGGGEDVVAWQYLRTNYIPMWVVQNFHDLHAGAWAPKAKRYLTHRSGAKLHETDWVLRSPDLRIRVCNIFTDAEFQEHFVKLPENFTKPHTDEQTQKTRT